MSFHFPSISVEFDSSANSAAPFKVSLSGAVEQETSPKMLMVQMTGGYGGTSEKKQWTLLSQVGVDLSSKIANSWAKSAGARMDFGVGADLGKIAVSFGLETASDIVPVTVTINAGN